MSRVEPNRNVYVGHRYVPKIFGEWDKKNQYEGLSIVTHQGNSYTSKKRVPVGIDILNEEYWVVTGNYNAQVEEYRKEVKDLSTYVDTELDKKSDQTYVDTELGKKSDKTYVDTELDKKSDISYVDTELGKKSDKTYVDTELDKKSDKTYVDTELDKKTDVITERVDYYIPDDYGTLAQAISDLYKKHSNGVTVNIIIRSGHRPLLRMNIRDSVLPNIKLRSEDDIVKIGDNLDDTQNLIDLANVYGFHLNCLIDMEGQGNHGIHAQSGSFIRVNTGCGIINAGGDGLHVRTGSTAYAQYSIFTGAGKNIIGSEERAGISAWGGIVRAHGADVSGSRHHGARAAHSGTLDFDNGTANNCGYHGIRASQGGRLICRGAVANHCGIHGIYALHNSFINADRSDASYSGRVGYNATAGSIVDANQGIANNCDVACDASTGSLINFVSGEADNCKTAGVRSTQSSTVECRNININGEQDYGAYATENSTVNMQNSYVRGSKLRGIHCTRSSSINADVSIVRQTQPGNESAVAVFVDDMSKVSIAGSQVWDTGGKDLRVDKGSQINAHETVTSSGVVSGGSNIKTPQLEDVNVSEFNKLTRLGIIYV